ncbi:class I SAM-dependent methyltransferase [Shewanella cyperi]|uniref:class I SAM-dependent methyltransferase n=1 Tax=Shewanella cyperi TaxID=2814292 RepID=UPI001A940CE2|nr:class I SAM-dependent methyltransferase [Shewanella cyperi]QSX40440.1 class I SAM-dependent methyltransferase [Shewanella cyperi]
MEQLSERQRKALHGADYVARFSRQSPARLSRLLDQIHIPSGARVVDFGCGDGAIIGSIKDRIGAYTGVDFSAEFIAAANHRKRELNASRLKFECAAITDFSQNHAQDFDIGLCLDLSEHVYDDEWQAIVNAMFHCLRPGGNFYQHTPNADFILEIMKQHNVLLRQFPEHIAVRNAAENLGFLRRAGFSNIRVHFIPHYNVARLLHPLSALPKVGKYFQARLLLSAQKPMV